MTRNEEEAGSGLNHPNRPTRSTGTARSESTAPPDRNSRPVQVERSLALGRLARWAARGPA